MNQKVTLSMMEIKRMYMIQQLADIQMTGPQAAELLGLSLRQIRHFATAIPEEPG